MTHYFILFYSSIKRHKVSFKKKRTDSFNTKDDGLISLNGSKFIIKT